MLSPAESWVIHEIALSHAHLCLMSPCSLSRWELPADLWQRQISKAVEREPRDPAEDIQRSWIRGSGCGQVRELSQPSPQCVRKVNKKCWERSVFFSLAVSTVPMTTASSAPAALIRRWSCGTSPPARSRASSEVTPGSVLLVVTLWHNKEGFIFLYLLLHLCGFALHIFLCLHAFFCSYFQFLLYLFHIFCSQKVNCVQFNEEATVILSGESSLM